MCAQECRLYVKCLIWSRSNECVNECVLNAQTAQWMREGWRRMSDAILPRGGIVLNQSWTDWNDTSRGGPFETVPDCTTPNRARSQCSKLPELTRVPPQICRLLSQFVLTQFQILTACGNRNFSSSSKNTMMNECEKDGGGDNSAKSASPPEAKRFLVF